MSAESAIPRAKTYPARLSAGVVIVRVVERKLRFLLLRAYRNWDFPKGLVEPGEEPLDAALREVQEETALDDISFDWGVDFFETGPYSKGKTARYYLARSKADHIRLLVNPAIGMPEHHEARWFEAQAAYDIVSPRLKPVVSWAYQCITGRELAPADPEARV